MFFQTALFLFCYITSCLTQEVFYEESIDDFNKKKYSWKARVYDREFAYGSIIDEDQLSEIEVITHEGYNFSALPESFDAREKWPNCSSIRTVLCQGKCGSCWAFAAATVASDRTCIHASVDVQLSEQDFQCCKDCFPGNVCDGGADYKAFAFWLTDGLVTDTCKPYHITELLNTKCKYVCKDSGIDYKNDKHSADAIYKVKEDENVIKAELFENGPISVPFKVYTDFRKYSSGVYQVADDAQYTTYNHSMRLIGYGIQNDLPYWLVVNSYGSKWGEKGLIKVKRFDSKLAFEKNLLTGLPKK